jgi:hypothetical protein
MALPASLGNASWRTADWAPSAPMQIVPVAVVLSANVAVTSEGVEDREIRFLLYYDYTNTKKN